MVAPVVMLRLPTDNETSPAGLPKNELVRIVPPWDKMSDGVDTISGPAAPGPPVVVNKLLGPTLLLPSIDIFSFATMLMLPPGPLPELLPMLPPALRASMPA